MKKILIIAGSIGVSLLPFSAFAYTDAEILASSTNVLTSGVSTLLNSVFAFLPIILGVAIPLGLLYAAYRWVTHRGRVR